MLPIGMSQIVKLQIDCLEIAVVDHDPKELLNVTLKGVQTLMCVKEIQTTYQLAVESLQIDNQLANN